MSRYALVTGATSGIGLALAEALARRGRNLLLVARQREALEAIAAELSRRFSVEVLIRACDLSKPTQLTGLLMELEEGTYSIDLLVNNAGLGTSGAFVAQDWQQEQQLIEVNMLALARLCQSVGNVMAGQGSGQILNVASIAAFHPGAWMANYYASKAYVLHLSEALREELKEHGVAVSVLCPGPTRSAFFRKAALDDRRLRSSKLMMSAEEVALITVRALDKNRAIIIPGWRNRLLALSPKLAPRWLVRKISARLNRQFLAQR
ncbi:SDR family oxidoreductase [Pseudomonas sp. M30-35]|uniref:SDR family NAD(P)-dependent oxidoreductase n=1 Tax=Pseudomonas sp. M30-35 TaxID=1981174 RepID=UPI000B3D33D9|nr:SDR family oxidoreductase [Pseudomonas sp. M30-35]ARU87022.1 short-chain dehydrogenase [Pseudomonas sp. M30-35]